MSADQRVERLLASWLADQPAIAPDRLLDSVISDVGQTPQRGLVRAAVRSLPMFGTNALRIYAVAATFVVVAVVAFAWWPRQAVVGPGQPTPTPSASINPTPAELTPSPAPVATQTPMAAPPEASSASVWVHLQGLTGLNGQELAAFLISDDDLSQTEVTPDERIHGFQLAIDSDPYFALSVIRSPLVPSYRMTDWPVFGEGMTVSPGNYMLMLFAADDLMPYGAGWMPGSTGSDSYRIDGCALPVTAIQGQQTQVTVTALQPWPGDTSANGGPYTVGSSMTLPACATPGPTGSVLVRLDGLTGLEGMELAGFLLANKDLRASDAMSDDTVRGFPLLEVNADPYFAIQMVRSPRQLQRFPKWPTFGDDTAVPVGRHTLIIWTATSLEQSGWWLYPADADQMDACALQVDVNEGQQTVVDLTGLRSPERGAMIELPPPLVPLHVCGTGG